MRLKYEKVIHHAIVNNLFGLESMKKSCNAQGSSKYYLFVTASFASVLWIIYCTAFCIRVSEVIGTYDSATFWVNV